MIFIWKKLSISKGKEYHRTINLKMFPDWFSQITLLENSNSSIKMNQISKMRTIIELKSTEKSRKHLWNWFLNKAVLKSWMKIKQGTKGCNHPKGIGNRHEILQRECIPNLSHIEIGIMVMRISLYKFTLN